MQLGLKQRAYLQEAHSCNEILFINRWTYIEEVNWQGKGESHNKWTNQACILLSLIHAVSNSFTCLSSLIKNMKCIFIGL